MYASSRNSVNPESINTRNIQNLNSSETQIDPTRKILYYIFALLQPLILLGLFACIIFCIIFLSKTFQEMALKENNFYKPNLKQKTYQIKNKELFYKKEFENLTKNKFMFSNDFYIFAVENNKIYANNEIQKIGEFKKVEIKKRNPFVEYLDSLENKSFVVLFNKNINSLIFYVEKTTLIERIFKLKSQIFMGEIMRDYHKKGFKHFLYDLSDEIEFKENFDKELLEKNMNGLKFLIYKGLLNGDTFFVNYDTLFLCKDKFQLLVKNVNLMPFFINLFKSQKLNTLNEQIIQRPFFKKENYSFSIKFQMPNYAIYTIFYKKPREEGIKEEEIIAHKKIIVFKSAFWPFFWRSIFLNKKIKIELEDAIMQFKTHIFDKSNNLEEQYKKIMKEKDHKNVYEKLVKSFYNTEMKFDNFSKIRPHVDFEKEIGEVLEIGDTSITELD